MSLTKEDHGRWMNMIEGTETVTVRTEFLKTILDAALRLSAIEAAGDEDIEDLRERYWGVDESFERGAAFDKACHIIHSQRLDITERDARIESLTRERDEAVGLLKWCDHFIPWSERGSDKWKALKSLIEKGGAA